MGERSGVTLQLFAHPFSSYSQKVLIALWADGTEFAYRRVPDDEENYAELKRHWPFGLFPLLLDDGQAVVETSCIIEHLQAHHPGPNRWIPDGELGRRVRFLDRFFDLYVMNNMSCPVFNAIRPEDQRDPYGVEQAMGRLATAYDWLESNLGDGPWAAGEQFTLADCAAIVHLPLVSSVTKIIYGRDYLAGLPVRDYLTRMAERPHVQRVNADRKTNTAEMLARPPKR